MRSINKVIIIGNLTRDPVMKVTQSGQPVATFGVATNRQWTTRDNQRHDSTEFHEVVAWARLAEICEQYIRKGNLVYIEGYLKTRSWDDPSGQGKRYRTEVVIQDIIMLEKRRDGGSAGGSAPGGQDSGTWESDMDQQMAEASDTSGSGGFGGGVSSDEPPLDELDLGLGEAISQDDVR